MAATVGKVEVKEVKVVHDPARGIWTLVLPGGKRIEFHDAGRLARFRERNGL